MFIPVSRPQPDALEDDWVGNNRRLQGLPSLTLKVSFVYFLEISGPACRRLSQPGLQDL